ncbi:metallophosphoesterase [Cereibacter sphaeroides]|uniref:metallophosphoesterase n=1 Tax=Cereibacter sphaeroides TaxID=1063 RepID=UPI001F31869F|nr:metallophosphoesterase [Cereibacter sphaeroides]MCE6958808.1 metallophosphoesterase [Cereibacter sphaeroides]MCE6973318.1 metallophosphoesterase [Cereibacter sphaeroides]
MARLLFWSDLHCEFRGFELPVPADLPGATAGAPARGEIDGILIAGDTDVKGRHVDLAICAWDLWRVPVLMIDGNHEPYGMKRIQKLWELEERKLAEARELGVDIDILHRRTRVIGDTRVIGATLWTDCALWPEWSGAARAIVRDAMNDYRRIRYFDEPRGIYRRLDVQDTVAFHRADKAFILGELARPFAGRTIVMSHHLPAAEMLDPTHAAERKAVTSAYASDLWPEIREHPLDAWICGHSHTAREARLEGAHGPVAFLNNIRGYPGEETVFDPLRILDSAAPRLRLDGHVCHPVPEP